MRFYSFVFSSYMIFCGFLVGEAKVADIFSDNMVLQQGVCVPVWGKAQEGESVTVSFKEQSITTVADAKGFWRLDLQPLEISSKGTPLIIKGENKIIFKEVLVGEVWLASGQSNMEWKLKQCLKELPELKSYIDQSVFPGIRYRAIKVKENLKEQRSLNDQGKWQLCSSETVGDFSAVAFFFANKLYKELQTPIGIIECAWGGHPIEPFIPQSAFAGHQVLEKELRLAAEGDFKGLRDMVGGVYARNNSWLPGTVYNSRIAPVAPYALKGAVWYQAESNCGKGEDPRFYSEKMKALINGWRRAWQQPKMPVYFVQLPQYDSPNWIYMRDEQRRALSCSSTGMAVIIDLALGGIHPPNKLDVGERLALLPMEKDYDLDVQSQGPLFKGFSILGSKVQVSFSEIGSGLATGSKKDLHETKILSSKEVFGFELCDANGRWFPAKAVIQGDSVVCESSVPKPVAVRYAWGTHMQEQKWNLYNKEGLPASPFISNQKYANFILDK